MNHPPSAPRRPRPRASCRPGRGLPVALALGLLVACGGGCGAGAPRDPYETLKSNRVSSSAQIKALARLDAAPPSPRYVAELERIILSPKGLLATREACVDRLARRDPAALERLLTVNLPLLRPTEFRSWVIQRAGELGNKGLTKAIIRSWAMPVPYWERDAGRQEPEVLARMYGGPERVDVVLVDTMLNARPFVERNLRYRCWELLIDRGRRDLLVELVNDDELVGDDEMLLDLRASVNELGVVPRNKEEILWIRELRARPYRAYWERMGRSFSRLDEQRRSELAPRDLAVVVAAARHRPELLERSDAELYRILDQQIGASGPRYTADFSGWTVKVTERLSDVRGRAGWSDFVAMALAREALADDRFREHLFDQADRDLIDTTTEFGGIIRLDESGRFELVEHPPRSRVSDEKFLAPQSLFDDGYTALFHFHNHAQNYSNRRHAGPHMGDLQYAEETGANCLVFTFVKPNLLNVDFYRADEVVVDLGTVERPGQG